MVSLTALWLPVLLSAILVFFASTFVHMVLKYHASDYKALPNEEAVRAAIRNGNPATPAQYIIPHIADMKQMGSPETKKKYEDGPVAVLTLKRNGPFTMGPNLAQWFVFTLVVSFFVAWVTSQVLPMGTAYMKVFQVAGTVAFLSYAAGQLPASIWMGKPWSIAAKEVLDGLIYGLVTAGAFGWLWPR
jgi:hypothetical protein